MFRLPVSGLVVEVRAPCGADDVLLMESGLEHVELALKLASRLASRADADSPDWGSLCVTDFDSLLLFIRSSAFGDLVRATARCATPGCNAPIDISFCISDYLDHLQPHIPRNVEAAEATGWYRLHGSEATFRLPSAADQAAIARQDQPKRELIRRCISPTDAPGKVVRRIETAMAALAPPAADYLESRCPECGKSALLFFDPVQFTLRELCGQAAYIYQDVHLLAACYGWSEESILALPRTRRTQYVEMARSERRSA